MSEMKVWNCSDVAGYSLINCSTRFICLRGVQSSLSLQLVASRAMIGAVRSKNRLITLCFLLQDDDCKYITKYLLLYLFLLSILFAEVFRSESKLLFETFNEM